MKKLLTAIVVSMLVTTVHAQEEIRKRPDSLKAQVDVMKQEVPDRFKCMIAEIKKDHGDDKSTSLYVLKRNVDAYWDLREGSFPANIIADAFNDHPCDFSTAMYVIKRNTKAGNELESLLN